MTQAALRAQEGRVVLDQFGMGNGRVRTRRISDHPFLDQLIKEPSQGGPTDALIAFQRVMLSEKRFDPLREINHLVDAPLLEKLAKPK